MSVEECVIKNAQKKFEAACAKLEYWDEMCQDDDFEIYDNPNEVLRELKEKFNSPELINQFNYKNNNKLAFEDNVNRIEKQIRFNEITNKADLIYGKVLECAKTVAMNLESELDREKINNRVYRMGVIKEEIDFDKNMVEELSGERIYSRTKKIRPILTEHALVAFLYGK